VSRLGTVDEHPSKPNETRSSSKEIRNDLTVNIADSSSQGKPFLEGEIGERKMGEIISKTVAFPE
jgi:hypothetical protein